MTELAIFSIDHFLFGVETAQIQEILAVKYSDFSEKTDPALPFGVLQYRQHLLPVFDLRRRFCLSPSHIDVFQQDFSAPLVSFYVAGFLVACYVTSVEDIITISSRLLKPVPPVLTKTARENYIWGFCEISSDLLPLIDLEHVISPQDINLYTIFLSELQAESGLKRKI